MFPAYRNGEGTSQAIDIDKPEQENQNFLENQSYTSIPVDQKLVEDSSSSSDSENDKNDGKVERLMLKERSSSPIEPPQMYFFEDRQRRKEYLQMESLPFRAVPMFNRLRKRKIGSDSRHNQKFKRYFKSNKIKKLLLDTGRLLDSKETDEEEMRIFLTKNPHEVDKWIEYIQYQNSVALGPKEQNEKIRLETIEKALHFNHNEKRLLQLYLDVIPSVHSRSDVKKIIEDLISKDKYNFTLWRHLLSNHQSSMSCDVDNTLKLYEKTMNTLKRHQDSDPQLIMLFKSCCMFLKQCGLNEQFFAIIHLMLSLNITTSPEIDKLFYANELQNPLLTEYEELVLKSNLPMNELWYRMEVLRSICNFLPVRETSAGNMNDPQRFIFNEDICVLVNPLKNSLSYNFDLFIVILKLLKIPMPHRHINNELFTTDAREIECGMDFLPILMEKTFSCDNFNKIIYIVAKDLNVAPNYTNFNIENEAYFELISKLLLLSCNSFSDRQNKIVLIIWLKLQRLAVVMDQMKTSIEKNSTIDKIKYKKQTKSRVKNALKNSKYQNDLYVFKEYALIEKSLGDDSSCQNILNMAIENAPVNRDETDFYSVVLELCEQILLEGDKIACIEKLRHLSGDNLEVLDYFNQRIDLEKFDENPHEIEEYFMPTSNKFNLIKAKVFYVLSRFTKRRALDEILSQISQTSGILREKLYELFFWIFLLKWPNEVISMKFFLEIAVKALETYPKNVYILHSISSHRTLRWFDIRKILLKTPTIESVFYLLLASKFHEDKFSDEENTKIYKHRIYNIIDRVVNSPDVSSILIWRIYLRTAFSFDFTKCKRILYQTLDNNPMIKQLYLDGARYLPEEHSQLLDLIVEKGLRAHSLAEELEILRTQAI